MILVVLAICAVVLSLILNIMKALLIVGAVGVAFGLGLGLRRARRKPAPRPLNPAKPNAPRLR